MISLCMIVKNEEDNIRNCLQVVKDFVDEIIIVDTGSSDATKEICFRYTDKVYDFKWNDDFADARNFSISKASKNWILVLDADEELMNFNKEQIIKFVENKNNYKLVGRIKIINILEDEMGTKRYIERVNRVFNKKYYKYKGTIHEQICNESVENYNTINLDISADHIGYTKGIMKKTDKIQRNLELLQQSIKNGNKDPYLYYQLGKTYYLDKKYGKSIECFDKALDFKVNTRYEYVQDLVETYGYSLINTGRYAQALELKKYEEEYSSLLDYKFLMALIYMNNALFEQAIKGFLGCIGEKEGKMEGLNSYLSCYNIGVIYECSGLKKEANFYYKKCGDYKPALDGLNRL
ncbi:glycosyltransferase family 2 protein [Clostridium gasigenes]|uniref:glycosyltransferase family 2 protein n=1 Tax=Clostridium gasigenes TaxID=94869 RepID=UPI001C0CCC15|nr:glycosyltransferase family 2 protein [Clostridium gasigenes]MBU3109454.1 glycosyltransferase family 2 protein [Clostridium gasigenes]